MCQSSRTARHWKLHSTIARPDHPHTVMCPKIQNSWQTQIRQLFQEQSIWICSVCSDLSYCNIRNLTALKILPVPHWDYISAWVSLSVSSRYVQTSCSSLTCTTLESIFQPESLYLWVLNMSKLLVALLPVPHWVYTSAWVFLSVSSRYVQTSCSSLTCTTLESTFQPESPYLWVLDMSKLLVALLPVQHLVYISASVFLSVSSRYVQTSCSSLTCTTLSLYFSFLSLSVCWIFGIVQTSCSSLTCTTLSLYFSLSLSICEFSICPNFL